MALSREQQAVHDRIARWVGPHAALLYERRALGLPMYTLAEIDQILQRLLEDLEKL